MFTYIKPSKFLLFLPCIIRNVYMHIPKYTAHKTSQYFCAKAAFCGSCSALNFREHNKNTPRIKTGERERDREEVGERYQRRSAGQVA